MPKPTSVRLPPQLRERLTAAAIEERRTSSNLLRVLVEDGLAARDRKTPPRRTAAPPSTAAAARKRSAQSESAPRGAASDTAARPTTPGKPTMTTKPVANDDDWRSIGVDTLSLIYHSLDPRHDPDTNRWTATFNETTWDRWERILAEIGRELERRRPRMTDRIVVCEGHPQQRGAPSARP